MDPKFSKQVVPTTAPNTIRIGDPSKSNQSARSLITVVRDPQHTLGKKFTLNPSGTISKQAAVSVSVGMAVMHQVNTHDELATLLKTVGNDPHAAIINASFPGIEVGEEFLILSEKEIEKQTGIPRNDREQQKGIHAINYNESYYKAVGRFKENVLQSCWQYFDRDIDKHTPEKYAKLSFEEWLSALAGIIQGLADISHCRIGSTSARVLHNDKPVGVGNGHLWFKVTNPEDIERFRAAILVAATKADLTWKKPRFSRKEPGKIVGHSLTTIIDPSVFTPGRLTFIGRPVVNEGLTVAPLSASTHIGEKDSVDTSLVITLDEQNIREITRKAGVEMDVKSNGNGLRITAHDLTLGTELETEDQGVLTLRELIERGIDDKIRCQTPFRDSSSFAAFVSTGKDGRPFVFDVGTGITHWLSDSDSEYVQAHQENSATEDFLKNYEPTPNRLKKDDATSIIKDLLERAKNDCGAPFEPESVEALAVIKKNSPAEFARIRSELKNTNKDVSVVELDAAIKEVKAETHHGYATDMIGKLTVGEWPPVGYEGDLYVVNPNNNIWVKHPTESIRKRVAETHDGKPNCQRSSDYSGIANHVVMLATDDTFFADPPIGLATPDGFYKIKDNRLVVESLSPSHRQRVKIDVTPGKKETPLFDKFLHETFKSSVPEEEEQQLRLLQEFIGSIMFGITARHQKAGLFFDPFGRAGKGTMERIIVELVPSSFVTAVSPFKWDNEYYLASLVGSRFNSVGELPDSKPIPAAAFKTVIGGDLLTGRHPTHRPVTFKNEAAHLFMSNHVINTKDHSEAFFTRWLIIEFPNSLLRSGLPIDPGLAERIIENELPGIAYWASEGAMRLLSNGKFSKSIAHDRLMEKWRHSTNSLEEFIHECCELVDSKEHMRRAEFYREYKNWCDENGRRPFAKGKVLDLIAHNIGLGISHAKLDGYEIFRGIKKNDSSNVPNPLFPNLDVEVPE